MTYMLNKQQHNNKNERIKRQSFTRNKIHY